MSIIWTIIIGFVAGVIAKFIMPGDNEPSGFILTTILGIVGAFFATYLGQSLVVHHSDFDVLIPSHSRIGKLSGGTRISMLLGTPG
ncbi:GlsB/YeaQ/YmgE family stress response membrane protein [Bradyrhizobium barranii]